ncbi:hypothetical protein, partial [Pseudomonas viridiflava]|uniref:hypothetical protein n=1 Tax=Pseudomonas viridiflava TaxID=33069 RepID=UPI001F15071F
MNAVTPPVGAVIEVRSPLVYPNVVFLPSASVYVVMSPVLFFVHDTERELEPLVCENVCTPLAYDEFAVRAPATPAVETRDFRVKPGSSELKLIWFLFRSTIDVGWPARLKCVVEFDVHPFSVYSCVVLLSTRVR